MAGRGIKNNKQQQNSTEAGSEARAWAQAAAAADDDEDDDNNKETFKFYCTFPVVVGCRTSAAVGDRRIDGAFFFELPSFRIQLSLYLSLSLSHLHYPCPFVYFAAFTAGAVSFLYLGKLGSMERRFEFGGF